MPQLPPSHDLFTNSKSSIKWRNCWVLPHGRKWTLWTLLWMHAEWFLGLRHPWQQSTTIQRKINARQIMWKCLQTMLFRSCHWKKPWNRFHTLVEASLTVSSIFYWVTAWEVCAGMHHCTYRNQRCLRIFCTPNFRGRKKKKKDRHNLHSQIRHSPGISFSSVTQFLWL